jgi:hypothetical protein
MIVRRRAKPYDRGMLILAGAREAGAGQEVTV